MQKNTGKKDFYDRLRDIAWQLNQLREPPPAGMKSWTAAWENAELIVRSVVGDVPSEPGNTLLSLGNHPPSLKWGMTLYNRTFERIPVRLAVVLPKNKTSPMPIILPISKTRDPLVLLGITLWRDYFNNPNRDRLKQCWGCKTWFVDRTKNGLKHFCAPRCSHKWWSRPLRREWNKLKEGQKANRPSRKSPLTREAAMAVLGRLKTKRDKSKRSLRQESTGRKSGVSWGSFQITQAYSGSLARKA